MNTSTQVSVAKPGHQAFLACSAAMLSLAIAMGVGRFAFTPLFPLMVRDGLLASELGALLASSNYLGYLIGALLAPRINTKASTVITTALLGTAVVTAAVGWTTSIVWWTILRFVAGALSAWTLVVASAWGLGWLGALGRQHMAGAIFAGVGLGIAAAGVFCLMLTSPGLSSLAMWSELGLLAAVAALVPVAVVWRLAVPVTGKASAPVPERPPRAPSRAGGLTVCYALFGFGYILPATYLPALARQLVSDPKLFGLAWPLFGFAAAVSTVIVSWGLKKANRLTVWAFSDVLMGAGVLLPSVLPSLASVVVAAVLVGGTFMVITMTGMQEARARAQGDATAILGRMTAGFAVGQLAGPLVSAGIRLFTTDYSTALNYALGASATGLFMSAIYLWREARRDHIAKEH